MSNVKTPNPPSSEQALPQHKRLAQGKPVNVPVGGKPTAPK